MLRAVSHLIEVAVDDYMRLFHRFRALSIYEPRTLPELLTQKDSPGNGVAIHVDAAISPSCASR